MQNIRRYTRSLFTGCCIILSSPLLAAPEAPSERTVLYYRNPMGLADTSPAPKKDSMGMDYIPVYADEMSTPGHIVLSPEKIQKIGVRTQAVRRVPLTKTVRAAGILAWDERTQAVVAPRFEGWIEQLHVDTVGQSVRRGDLLARVYSPELIWAQREYEKAQAAGMPQVAESVLARLRNWQVPDDHIEELRRSSANNSSLRIQLRAPVDGIVIEKAAINGMRFAAGEALYKIVDLSNIWVHAEVFERDIPNVRIGQATQIMVNAYPGEPFSGKVTFIYPTLDPQTRTVKVRIELANNSSRLKPAMYAMVDFAVGERVPVLTIPASAVLESGTRQVVLVDMGEGRFAPRNIVLGQRGDMEVAVRKGLKEGERVVVSANFLIDAESNLRAALESLTPAPTEASDSAPTTTDHSAHDAHTGH